MSRIAIVGGHGKVARHLLVELRRSGAHASGTGPQGDLPRGARVAGRRGAAARHRASGRRRVRCSVRGLSRGGVRRRRRPRRQQGAQAHCRPRGLAEVDRGSAEGRDRPVRAGLGDRGGRPPSARHRRCLARLHRGEARRRRGAARQWPGLDHPAPGPPHRRRGHRAGRAGFGRRAWPRYPGPTWPQCWRPSSTRRGPSADSGTWCPATLRSPTRCRPCPTDRGATPPTTCRRRRRAAAGAPPDVPCPGAASRPRRRPPDR